MQTYPNVQIRRVRHLEPGDLYIYQQNGVSYVAMSIIDEALNGDQAVLTLGPRFSENVIGPMVSGPTEATAISFGKNFDVRLPSDAVGWATEQPENTVPCLVVTDNGSMYFRANFASNHARQFQACYVDIATGHLIANTNARSYAQPTGHKVFASKWSLITTEVEPRIILSV